MILDREDRNMKTTVNVKFVVVLQLGAVGTRT